MLGGDIVHLGRERVEKLTATSDFAVSLSAQLFGSLLISVADPPKGVEVCAQAKRPG
jgi:hypothetical protein